MLDVRPPEPAGRQSLAQCGTVVEVDLDGPHTDAAQGDLGGAVDGRPVDEQRIPGQYGGVERRADRARARALHERGVLGAEEVGQDRFDAGGGAGTTETGDDAGVRFEELGAFEVGGGRLQQPELPGDRVVQCHGREGECLR